LGIQGDGPHAIDTYGQAVESDQGIPDRLLEAPLQYWRVVGFLQGPAMDQHPDP
jgi:hypothetical protein